MAAVLPQSSPEKAPPRTIAALTIVWGGIMISEAIYTGLLALTLSRFTSDVAVIGWILAMKPMLSLVVQPAAGIITDRLWTPIGRRAVFLILFAPALGACLYVLPDLTSFPQVVAVTILFQFFQDVVLGTDHPLLADLIPAPQRTFVMGLLMTSGQIVTYLFLWIGLGFWMGKGGGDAGWLAGALAGTRWEWILQPHGEAFLYKFCAVAQTIIVCVASFFLGEKPGVPQARPKLTLRRYFADYLGDPMLRRFALLGFTQYCFQNLVVGFVALFAVKTLQLSAAEFGGIWRWQALIAVSAFALGALIERLPKQWVLAGGFGLSTVACALGYFAHDGTALLTVAFVFGVGQLIGNLTLKPFFTEFVPRDIIGQISGAFNTSFALARMLALGVGGMLVKFFAQDANDYRSMWLMAVVMGIATAAVCLTIPDRRHAARRQQVRASQGS